MFLDAPDLAKPAGMSSQSAAAPEGRHLPVDEVPRRASHLSPPKKPSPHSKVRDHGFKTYYESQEIRTEKLADLTGKQLLFESKMAAQKLALAKLNSGISNLVDDNNKTYRVMNGRVDDIFLK